MIANNTRPRISGAEAAKRNRDSVVRVGLMVAIALALALSAPAELVVAVFSGLMFISACIAGVFALFAREDPFAAHFTRWDETAVLLGVSIAAGMMVRPDMLERAADRQARTPAALVSAPIHP
ncbi:MAG: hypothetical protein U1E66_07690 [Rhodospirillales bacterium]